MVRRFAHSPLLAALVAGSAVLVLWVGVQEQWPVAVRVPLAVLVFLAMPGYAITRALRISAGPAVVATLAVGFSLALDMIGAELLVVMRVATVRDLLAVIGGVCAVIVLASLGRRIT